MQSTEIKYLTRVKEVTRKGRICRNTPLRQELEVQAVINFIERKQLSWWGHIQRMNNNRPDRQVQEAKIQGKLKRIRPRQTQKTKVGKIFKRKGRDGSDMAKHRKKVEELRLRG